MPSCVSGLTDHLAEDNLERHFVTLRTTRIGISSVLKDLTSAPVSPSI